jgi:hypothetical protein
MRSLDAVAVGVERAERTVAENCVRQPPGGGRFSRGRSSTEDLRRCVVEGGRSTGGGRRQGERQ